MVRTTVTIPEELLERLKRIAAKRGVPVSVIIREAIEESAKEERPEPERSEHELPRKFKSMGMARSGYTDTSVLAGEIRIEPRSWR